VSHFTQIKTELRNLNMVRAALRRQGIEFEIGGTVEDYFHNVQRVDIVAHIAGQRPVGFVQNNDTGLVELVGDWWGAEITQEEFLSGLKGSYAREQVMESLEKQGVDLSKVKELEEPDGSVVFIVPLDEEELQSLTA
jgi:hypothetical protein